MSYRDDAGVLRERIEHLQRSLSDEIRRRGELEIRVMSLEAELAIAKNDAAGRVAATQARAEVARVESAQSFEARTAQLQTTLALARAEKDAVSEELARANEMGAHLGRLLFEAIAVLQSEVDAAERRADRITLLRPLLAQLNDGPWHVRRAVLHAAVGGCRECGRLVDSLAEGFLGFLGGRVACVRPWPKAAMKTIYGAWEVDHRCGVVLRQSRPTDPRDHGHPHDELEIRLPARG